MKQNTGNIFIPSFIITNIFLAITAPYLPILIKDLGYSSFSIGIFLSIFEIAGITGPFVLGFMADKKSNYRLSLIIACILPATAIFPLITLVHPLLTAVFLFFIAFGARSLVSLIDAITTINIGIDGNYGRIRVWGSISFIFMTLFLQWTCFLKPDNAANIGIWMFFTLILCFIPILAIPKPYLKREAHSHEKVKMLISFPKLYIVSGFIIIFLSRFGMAAVVTYFSLYVIEIIKWDAVGLLWALGAVAEVPFIFLSGKIINRFKAMPLLGLTAFAVNLRLLILAFLPFKPWIIFSTFLHSICFGICHPAAINFITSLYPAEKRGKGMSVYMIMGTALPSIAGILTGGAVIQALGYRELFLIYAAVSGLGVVIYFMQKTVLSRRN